MAKKESRPAWFKLYLNQKALIDSASDASVGRAIKAVLQYFENGEIPQLSPLEFAVFSSIKQYVDKSFEDYAETSRKNKSNAQKRWSKKERTSRNQSLQFDALCTSGIQSYNSQPLDATNAEEDSPKGEDSSNIYGDAAFKSGTPVRKYIPEFPVEDAE